LEVAPGLPAAAVRESTERVCVAIRNSILGPSSRWNGHGQSCAVRSAPPHRPAGELRPATACGPRFIVAGWAWFRQRCDWEQHWIIIPLLSRYLLS